MFGAGCFWGVEYNFSKLEGVSEVVSGYSGGKTSNPTYEQVCSNSTEHAEVVMINYDETVISYEDLLESFWKKHDPTTLNRQGPDIGNQYRSEIFCLDDDQYLIADGIKRNFNKEVYDDKIVTSISMADNFWIAEEYHQKYVRKKKNMIF